MWEVRSLGNTAERSPSPYLFVLGSPWVTRLLVALPQAWQPEGRTASGPERIRRWQVVAVLASPRPIHSVRHGGPDAGQPRGEAVPLADEGDAARLAWNDLSFRIMDGREPVCNCSRQVPLSQIPNGAPASPSHIIHAKTRLMQGDPCISAAGLNRRTHEQEDGGVGRADQNATQPLRVEARGPCHIPWVRPPGRLELCQDGKIQIKIRRS